MEKRAQQAERLESLGILAGGVAHDFNNLLAVILGHAELLDLDTDASHPNKAGLQAILDAGSRARDLSKQMLAYSGRAVFVTKTTNLTTFIRDMTGQLARELLGDTALIADIEESNPFVVDINVTQIRQVLLNLLLNARHANAHHVNVSVGTTYLTETPQQCVIDLELCPLQYHWLEVADDGCGMDNHTLKRIFDPFFSTRTDGSGLGLAAVLGILRAHKGTISVKSIKGSGTQIRVYFPASTEVVRDTAQVLQNGKDNRISNQNFLLVEDDPLVRDMTSTILTMEDNTVLSLSGLEAVNTRLADTASIHTFDLAVIDLTLGQDTGIDVLRKLRSRHPQLPAVIMSGYDATDALAGYSDENTVVFLQKPFNQQQLWNAVRQAQGLAVNI